MDMYNDYLYDLNNSEYAIDYARYNFTYDYNAYRKYEQENEE